MMMSTRRARSALKCGERAWGLAYRVTGHPAAPAYDTDLNLCARAEARLAELGWPHDLYYCDATEAQRPADFPHGMRFWLATAPASARVRALYAIAMRLGAAPAGRLHKLGRYGNLPTESNTTQAREMAAPDSDGGETD